MFPAALILARFAYLMPPMKPGNRMDLFGATALTGFALLMSSHQVAIKITNGGFAPVFAAGLRGIVAMLCVGVWVAAQGQGFGLSRRHLPACLLAGGLFALEFIMIFTALDHTSVARASIIFYSMPVWLALVAHFVLPGEVLTSRRILGLGLAMGGIALALMDRDSGQASWFGDLAALAAALSWGGIALSLRLTSIREMPAEAQLFWQLVFSTPILLLVAWGQGEWLRAPQAMHVAGLLYQGVVLVSFGYILWYALIKLYSASGVASFSFLSPVFSVLLGWIVLSEQINPTIWVALVLVAVGLILLNRQRARG